MAEQVITAPEGQQVEAPVQTVDYEKQFKELETKFKDLETREREAASTVSNIESYLKDDEIASQRAKLWVQAQQEKKDPKELWASLDPKPKDPKVQEVATQPTFDANKLKSEILDSFSPMLNPILEQQAKANQELEKVQLFKDEPWLTDEKYQQFEQKYGKTIDQLAGQIMASKGPFLSQQDRVKAQEASYREAHGKYVHLTEKQLLHLFMPEERDKYLVEGRRPAPKLPPGMVDKMSVGKAPELINQVRQKFRAIEGNHEAVGKLCEEFAPQMGLSPEEVYKLLEA